MTVTSWLLVTFVGCDFPISKKVPRLSHGFTAITERIRTGFYYVPRWVAIPLLTWAAPKATENQGEVTAAIIRC